MRVEVEQKRLELFMRELGRRASGPGRVYVVGGATAVLLGWRATTMDVDIKLEPEPAGVFEALRTLKDELQINVELASPDHFLPPLPGWQARSLFIAKYGQVEFFHYDLYSQALAKIERGHQRDLSDARAMFQGGLIALAELERLFAAILPELVRYPALDEDILHAKVEAFVTSTRSAAPGQP